MKLTSETVNVLKTFANINSNIAIGEQGVVRTVAIAKNIMAKAKITEVFPNKFGIYDLPEFLNCYSLFDDAELSFDDTNKFVTFSDGQQSIKYFFSDIENLVTSDKDVTMPDSDIEFTITDAQLASIRKASGALKANDMVITKNTEGGEWIKLTVTDTENPTSNEFSLNINNCDIKTDMGFKFVFNINNFKFNTATAYKYSVSSKMIASVVAGDVDYWLALDKNSKYGV